MHHKPIISWQAGPTKQSHRPNVIAKKAFFATEASIRRKTMLMVEVGRSLTFNFQPSTKLGGECYGRNG
jgi:hypothetical protein